MPTKVHLVKAMVFPVVMYRCESWTIKKAECWRVDAFELWCWRRLLRVPWTARRSNQSVLKEISSEYSLDWCWSSKTLVTWWELTRWKRPWCWERLKVGAEGDDRGWDDWMVSPTQWTCLLSKLQEMVKDREAWHATVRKKQSEEIKANIRHIWRTVLLGFSKEMWQRPWRLTSQKPREVVRVLTSW